MRVVLMVNPTASSVTPRRQLEVETMLRAHHDVRTVTTTARGHGMDLAAAAAADGTEVVVVLGGDGTLNEAANGLAGTTCALAALPGGSTNVFARSIGLPDDTLAAVRMNEDALAEGRVRPVGLGAVNGRHFLFHTGVGWDAMLVRQVELHSTWKRLANHALFVWAGLVTWFRRYDRTRPHFRLTHADGAVVEDGYFTVVLNSNPYTYVGHRPFDLSPHASLDRPLVSATITRLVSWQFLGLMMSALRSSGALERSELCDYRSDVTRLTIEAYDQVPYQVDGDDLGDATRLDFEYHPDVLRVVLPCDGPT